MKKMKKAVSMFLALAMIVSMCAFSINVSAETSEVKVLDSDYKVAKKLSELDIIDVVEDEALGNYVKRSDMIPVLMKYLRIEGAEMSGNGSPFLDVSYSDENVGSYRVLYWAGYIAGDDTKMFRPDDLLTYNEAITFVINAMGYRPFANRNGGYPAGYLYTANVYGLLEGLRGSGTNPIPFCDLYRLIEASVLADAVTYRYTANEDDTTFSLNPDLSILEELYGIRYIKGVVTGNENTRLNDQNSSGISRYQIRIGKTIYDTPGKEYADYLGKSVYAYAEKVSDGEYNIIYVEPISNLNKEYKLSADVIYKDKTTSTKIYYKNENGKEAHINLAGTELSVVYNGKSITGDTYGQLKDVMPDAGYILGIDNTGDKVVDVLFIYEYETYIVGAIDLVNHKIKDKYDTSNEVVLDSDEDEVRIYGDNGESLTFDDLAKGDVLCVMESMNVSDYKLIIAYRPERVIEGEITEIVGDEYKIGDKFYKKSDNNVGGKTLEIGSSATFFLDINDKIADFETSVTTDLTYGFLAAVQSKPGLNPEISVMIYSQNGLWIEANMGERVRVDDTSYYITKESGFNTIKATLERNVNEIVLYRLVGNTISAIDTKEDGGALTVISEADELFYRSPVAYGKDDISNGKFIVSSDMLIFKTPESDELLADTEAYKIEKGGLGSKALFESIYKDKTLTGDAKEAASNKKSGVDYEFIEEGYVAYKIGPSSDINIATCVHLKGTRALKDATTLDDGSAPMAIFMRTTQATDSNGDPRKKIYVLEGGKENGYVVDESKLKYTTESGTSTFTVSELNLGEGDIIQYSINNATGMIEGIKVVYRTSGNAPINGELTTSIASSFDGAAFRLTSPYGDIGTATFVRGDADARAMIVECSSTSIYSDTVTGETLFNISGATITLYNKAAKQEIAITVDDIILGDLILIRCSNYVTNATEILVIR